MGTTDGVTSCSEETGEQAPQPSMAMVLGSALQQQSSLLIASAMPTKRNILPKKYIVYRSRKALNSFERKYAYNKNTNKPSRAQMNAKIMGRVLLHFFIAVIINAAVIKAENTG